MSMSSQDASSFTAENFGGLTPANVSGAQDAIPLPWHYGKARFKAQFLAPMIGWDGAADAFESKSRGYASFIAAFCHGPVEVSNWSDFSLILNGSFQSSGSTFILGTSNRWVDFRTSQIQGYEPADVMKDAPGGRSKAFYRLHKGTLDAVDADRLHWPDTVSFPSGHIFYDGGGNGFDKWRFPWDHPPYRGVSYLETWCTYMYDNGMKRWQAPNIEMVLKRKPVRPAGFTSLDQTAFETLHANGINPVAAAILMLTDNRFTAAWPASRFNQSAINTLLLSLHDNRYAITPVIREVATIGDLIGDLLRYFDGYTVIRDGLLNFSMVPTGGLVISPGDVTELSQHDFVEPPSIDTTPIDELPNEVVVTYTDTSQGKYVEASVTVTAPASREYRGTPQKETVNRPWIVHPQQAMDFARHYLRGASTPQQKIEAKVRRNRAITPEGDPLLPGDLVQVDYLPLGVDLLCRIVQTEEPYDEEVVTLQLISERGQYPQPYIPPADLTPDLTIPDPDDIPVANLKVMPLPWGWLNAFAFTVLYSGYGRGAVYYGGTDGLSYNKLGETFGGPAISGALLSGIDSDDTSLTLTLTTLDVPEKYLAENDDWLILTQPTGQHAMEVMSIGAVTALGGGQYQFTVLRGRKTSQPMAHLSTQVCWIVLRESMSIFTNGKITPNIAQYMKIAGMNGFTTRDLALVTAVLVTFVAPKAEAAFTGSTPAENSYVSHHVPVPIEVTLTADPLPFSMWVVAYYYSSSNNAAMGAVKKTEVIYHADVYDVTRLGAILSLNWKPDFYDKSLAYNGVYIAVYTNTGYKQESYYRWYWLIVHRPEVQSYGISTAPGEVGPHTNARLWVFVKVKTYSQKILVLRKKGAGGYAQILNIDLLSSGLPSFPILVAPDTISYIEHDTLTEIFIELNNLSSSPGDSDTYRFRLIEFTEEGFQSSLNAGSPTTPTTTIKADWDLGAGTWSNIAVE